MNSRHSNDRYDNQLVTVIQIVPPPYSPFSIATAVSTTVLVSSNLYLHRLSESPAGT